MTGPAPESGPESGPESTPESAPESAPASAEESAELLPPSPVVLAAVRASCRAVADRPVRLAEVFYAHLFEMVPDMRSMFPDDLTHQMRKMTDTLLGAIAELDTGDTSVLEVELHRLGARHRTRFGVQPEHYMYIGHALTRAVRDVAGPGYSGSLSSSWVAVYQWVAAHMIAGADAVGAKPPQVPRQGRPMGSLPSPRRPSENDLSEDRFVAGT